MWALRSGSAAVYILSIGEYFVKRSNPTNTNDIIVPHPSVSANHGKLIVKPAKWVTDLGLPSCFIDIGRLEIPKQEETSVTTEENSTLVPADAPDTYLGPRQQSVSAGAGLASVPAGTGHDTSGIQTERRGHPSGVSKENNKLINSKASGGLNTLNRLFPKGDYPPIPPTTVLTLVDESKAGTVVNNSRVKGTTVLLKPGDTVMFGISNEEMEKAFRQDPKRLAALANQPRNGAFTIEYIPIHLMLSLVGEGERPSIVSAVQSLGGFVFKKFDPRATHLVMGAAETTPKLGQALLASIPVITTAWVTALMGRSNPSAPIPAVEPFVPTIDSAGYTSPSSLDATLLMWKGSNLLPQRRDAALRCHVYAFEEPTAGSVQDTSGKWIPRNEGMLEILENFGFDVLRLFDDVAATIADRLPAWKKLHKQGAVPGVIVQGIRTTSSQGEMYTELINAGFVRVPEAELMAVVMQSEGHHSIQEAFYSRMTKPYTAAPRKDTMVPQHAEVPRNERSLSPTPPIAAPLVQVESSSFRAMARSGRAPAAPVIQAAVEPVELADLTVTRTFAPVPSSRKWQSGKRASTSTAGATAHDLTPEKPAPNERTDAQRDGDIWAEPSRLEDEEHPAGVDHSFDGGSALRMGFEEGQSEEEELKPVVAPSRQWVNITHRDAAEVDVDTSAADSSTATTSTASRKSSLTNKYYKPNIIQNMEFRDFLCVPKIPLGMEGYYAPPPRSAQHAGRGGKVFRKVISFEFVNEGEAKKLARLEGEASAVGIIEDEQLVKEFREQRRNEEETRKFEEAMFMGAGGPSKKASAGSKRGAELRPEPSLFDMEEPSAAKRQRGATGPEIVATAARRTQDRRNEAVAARQSTLAAHFGRPVSEISGVSNFGDLSRRQRK